MNSKLFTSSDGLGRRDLAKHFEEGRRIEVRKAQISRIEKKFSKLLEKHQFGTK